MYFLGFAAAILTSFALKKTILKGPALAFILELPSYQMPQIGQVFKRVFERCSIFVRQTGGIILALSVLLWALLTFPIKGLDPPNLPRSKSPHCQKSS